MKAKSILLLVLLLVLCGCTSKMTCTIENDAYNSSASIVVNGKDVKDITVTNTYKSEVHAKNACEILSQTTDKIECKDKTIVLKNYGDTLSLSSMTKESVKEYFENHKYKCE